MHYYCKTFALIYACFAKRISTKSYTLTIDFQLQTRQY